MANVRRDLSDIELDILRLFLTHTQITPKDAEVVAGSGKKVYYHLNKLSEKKLIDLGSDEDSTEEQENGKRGKLYRWAGTPSDLIELTTAPDDPYREIRKKIIELHNPDSHEKVLEGAQDLISGNRPAWFFDIKSVIHPAVVVDQNFVITDWSIGLEKLFGKPPDDQSEREYRKFFGKFQFYPFDIETCQVLPERHAVDAILDELGKEGVVRQLVAFLDLSDREQAGSSIAGFRGEFLSISCVVQSAFYGFQSIMPAVTARINYMIRFRDLQDELYAAIVHDYKSPVDAISNNFYGLKQAIEKKDDILTFTFMNNMRDGIEALKTAMNSYTLKAKGESIFADVIQTLDASLTTLAAVRNDVGAVIEASEHSLKKGVYRSIVPLPRLSVEQAFRLVIRNAFEALDSPLIPKDKRKIIVRSFESGDNIEIQIADTGVGTTDDALAAAFKGGYSTKEGIYHGTGLALAKAVIESLGGRISASGVPSQGTTVSISLPVRKA